MLYLSIHLTIAWVAISFFASNYRQFHEQSFYHEAVSTSLQWSNKSYLSPFEMSQKCDGSFVQFESVYRRCASECRVDGFIKEIAVPRSVTYDCPIPSSREFRYYEHSCNSIDSISLFSSKLLCDAYQSFQSYTVKLLH